MFIYYLVCYSCHKIQGRIEYFERPIQLPKLVGCLCNKTNNTKSINNK
jgi:hypothetical protein